MSGNPEHAKQLIITKLQGMVKKIERMTGEEILAQFAPESDKRVLAGNVECAGYLFEARLYGRKDGHPASATMLKKDNEHETI